MDVTVVADLAAVVDGLSRQHRSLVAFDGPDAAGKTTLADGVAAAVTVPALRASVDGFHAPAAVRRRRGALSPEGYYHDSFDYDALEGHLLTPFAEGAGAVLTQVFDHRDDREVRERVGGVPANAALLFDGVFLLRPRLRQRWTLSVYVHVAEEVSLARGEARDLPGPESAQALRSRYRCRYLAGQRLYRTEANPYDAADIVLDNTDPAAPRVVRWTGPTAR